MRTYLYVDGENFAIRARDLHDRLQADASELATTKAQVFEGLRTGLDAPMIPNVWSPEPHKSMLERGKTRNGILYAANEVYWDALGLYVAFSSAMAQGHMQAQVPILKAYYFTGANGERVKQHSLDLHALGFAPHVLPRVKPDSWAKEMAAQGITVVSRPKPMDIQIATQVLDDCASNNFDRCIFIGGDEDYVPLLEAVRRRGKQVWLVAFERWLQKHNQLRLACDRFFAYDPVLSVRPLPVDPPST